MVLAGTQYNPPEHAEATPLFGDGTEDWTARGNAFYVDASRNGDVLAAIDFYDADSTAIISEWRPGSSVPLWTHEVHPCRSLVYGGWASRKPIRVSDDGSSIAVGVTMHTSEGSMGRLYAFEAGNPVPVVHHDLTSGSITAVEMTPGGEFIALASWPTVYVYDRYGASMRWSGAIGAGNDALAISDDGRYLAWGWSTFYLRQWTGSSYTHLWSTNQGSGYYVGQCGFSPDGGSLAIAWDNGSSSPQEVWVELHDVPSLDLVWTYDYVARGHGLRTLPGHRLVRDPTDMTTGLVFSPDSERIAISSWGGTFPEVHVFDRAESRPIFTLDTPGSMYDVEIVTTPHGDAYVVACGKAVHAGISGRGGDLYAVEIPGTPSGVDDAPVTTAPPGPLRCFPNPTRLETKIAYSVRRAGPVRLTVHDVSGRVVTSLIDGWMNAGEHTVVWNGRDATGRRAASGVYFARLESGGDVVNGRIVLLE